VTATPQPDNANAPRTDAPATPGDASRDASSVPAKRAPQPFYDACEAVAKGGYLAPWLRTQGLSRETFYWWTRRDAELLARFERARATGYEAIAEELLDIADAPLPADGDANAELTRRKLQSDNRKWLLERWSPSYRANPGAVRTGVSVSVSIATGVPVTGQRITVDATDATPPPQLDQGDDDASE